MNIVFVCVLCITASVLCKIVEKNTKEIAMGISLIAVAVVMLCIISTISDINDAISQLFLKADISEEYVNILFKSVGVCYITQIGVDTCKDCGENSLANVVELAGKISVMAISLPIIKALVTIIEGILI